MMQMNLNTAQALVNIASKPEVTARTSLLITLRVVRNILRLRDSIRAERRVFRRESAALTAYLPFTEKKMEELKQKSLHHRDREMQNLKKVLSGMGYWLMHDLDSCMEKIGFDGVCDLLNVNPTHRPEALEYAPRGLSGLIFIGRLEESASPKSDDWGRGGPLYEACHASMIEWVRTAPEGALPDLFGEDSPLGKAKLVSVSTETRQ
jgi:hypothetical protein